VAADSVAKLKEKEGLGGGLEVFKKRVESISSLA